MMLSFRTLARLTRISALPTLWSNVLTAFFLVTEESLSLRLVALLFACSALYLAGMVFNDVCDADDDMRERPDRPIPLDEISRTAARNCGIGLWALAIIGQAVCFAVIGAGTILLTMAFAFAVILNMLVLCYNFTHKRMQKRAPLLMAGCRLFNILFVFSIAGNSIVPSLAFLAYCVSVTAYIYYVTKLSQREAEFPKIQKWVGLLLQGLILFDALWCLASVGVIPAVIVLTLYPVTFLLRRYASLT